MNAARALMRSSHAAGRDAHPALRHAATASRVARSPELARACTCGGGCPRCKSAASTLHISDPGDSTEREADRVANAIMRMPLDEPVGRTVRPAIARSPVTLQREERPPEPGELGGAPLKVLEDKFDPRLDWFEMSRPLTTRGADTYLSGDTRTYLSIGTLWQNNYRFFFDFGLGDGLAADAANFVTPFAIDSALKSDFPSQGELFERNADISSLIISPTVFRFDLGDIPGTLRSPLSAIFGGRTDNPYSKKVRHTLGRQVDSMTDDVVMPSVDDSVARALQSPATPLPAPALAFFGERFGRNFSDVRVHTGDDAITSARAVHAKAYTVGRDVVFGSGQYQPAERDGQHLIAHELTHVIQQAGTPTSTGSVTAAAADTAATARPAVATTGAGALQRADDSQSDPAGSVKAPIPQLVAGGLPEPDCQTPVSDFFKLLGTITSANPACSTALIEDKRLTGRQLPMTYRADRVLTGKDPCPGLPGVPDAHTWLSNQWNVVAIDTTSVTVVNQCGDDERLVAKSGCDCPPAEKTIPERRVTVSESKLGMGMVLIFDGCSRAVFRPDDCCRPVLEFNRTVDETGWTYWTSKQFLDGGKPRMYAPSDVSRMLGVNVESGHCGDRFEAPAPVESEIGGGGSWDGF